MPDKSILHFTGMVSTKYGSLERYFLELASSCKKEGYVTVLQYETPPQSQLYLDDLKKAGVEVIILPLRIKTGILKSLRAATKTILSKRPEVIHTHFVDKHIHWAIPFIGRRSGARKIIATIHSDISLKKSSLIRFAFNQYDQVLTVSNAVTDNLLHAGVDPQVASTHYLGLFGQREKSKQLRDRIRREFGISDQAVVIACIAYDTPFKGLDLLLEAFRKVIDGSLSLQLIIIGVDPKQSDLPEQAKELGIARRVHWAGIRDQGWIMLNAADIYVQSSRFGEGLGLAAIEAMALDLPVVATRVAGHSGEVVIDGETGYLAEPDDIDSLAITIKRMLAEPSKWKIMGEAGHRRYLELFRGENSIQSLIDQCYRLR